MGFGLPGRQPAIIYTLYIIYCIFLWLIKIVVVVTVSAGGAGVIDGKSQYQLLVFGQIYH